MTRRYHGLDALRAGAMLLGVVLHACQFYQTPTWMAGIVPWVTATPPEASASTAMLAIWIHLWRMPVFFVLSGFFAQMVLERRGLWYLWQDRFIRIFLTLLIFHAFVVLIAGRPFGILAHLWFLWLLCFFCLALPATSRLAGFTRSVSPWILASFAICGAVGVGYLGRSNVWHEIPGKFTDPEWRGFVLYGFFFYLGQLLWVHRSVIDLLARRRVFAPLLLAGTIAWLELGRLYFAPLDDIMRQTIVAMATLGIGAGLIGLAERYVRKPHPVISRGVEMAYAIYLFHLYIVFNLSGLTIQWEWDQHLSIFVVSITGTAFSILCYVIFVKFTPLNWLLVGYGKSWWQWPFGPNGATKKAAPAERPS